MSNSSPLVPQGSLLEQQAKGRPHLRIALCIVAVHLIFLGGLLMQGCKRDQTPETAAAGDFPPMDVTNFPGVVIEVPPTTTTPPPVEELPPFFPEELGLGMAETSTVASPIVTTPPVPSRTPEMVLPLVPTQEQRTPTVPAPAPGVQEYTVVAGDYFIKIGKRFNVTAAAIAQANPGVDATRLQVGQKLRIPAPTPGTAAAQPVAAAAPGRSGVYEVKKGDTLTKIAREHGTTVAALKAANNLATERILIGQQLRLPAGAR